ncbi:MAG: hypothetical protein WC436_04480 [Candidatus Babeliales bacterium]
MFKKSFLALGLIIISGFNFCAAMEENNELAETVNSNVSEAEIKELRDILTEIRVIQYSCGHALVREWMVPRRCKGCSCKELQDKQRSLFPRKRELAAKMTQEQLDAIARDADKRANIEIEVTSDAGLGSAISDGCRMQ